MRSAALGAAYLADESLYRRLLVEDGLVEWIQTLGFAIGSAFSAAIAVGLARRGHQPAAAPYAVLMLSLFFIVGEETSRIA